MSKYIREQLFQLILSAPQSTFKRNPFELLIRWIQVRMVVNTSTPDGEFCSWKWILLVGDVASVCSPTVQYCTILFWTVDMTTSLCQEQLERLHFMLSLCEKNFGSSHMDETSWMKLPYSMYCRKEKDLWIGRIFFCPTDWRRQDERDSKFGSAKPGINTAVQFNRVSLLLWVGKS